MAMDESTFAVAVERHRRELQVHCYRMLGSYDESEDLVQETFLRAWRGRESFQGRASPRTWLYRIATNACLDALDKRPRRVMPPDVSPPADPTLIPPPPVGARPWLQPYPDQLLDAIAAPDAEPGAEVVSKETIELTFIAAVQHLPPRQRAVLILRDVLDWSANESAALLDLSVAAVNSALQRARGTLKRHLPARRTEWAASRAPDEQEQVLVQRFMDAHEKADMQAIADLLREDARLVMPLLDAWFDGRQDVTTAMRVGFGTLLGASIRTLPLRANRQPGFGVYFRPADAESSEHTALVIHLLRIEGAKIVEVTGFDPKFLPACGLPMTI